MTRYFYLVFMIWCLVFASSTGAKTIHVDITYGSTAYSGLSWAAAKDKITSGLSIADMGDTILVAEGRYVENITLIESISLYGGYPAGGGTRDFRAYETIIDGDYGLTVITAARSTVIDGFTVVNGAGTYPMIWPGVAKGGAIIAYPEMTITNNIFRENYILGDIEIRPRGGAIYVEGTGEAYIANNFFIDNSVGFRGDGAAIYTYQNNVRIINNTFLSNSAEGFESIVAFWDATPQVKNNIFVKNDGVAIRELTTGLSGHSITHNDFHENTAVYEDRDTMTTFTDVATMDSTVPEADENMECDPELITPDDFHLGLTSCCIDRADPAAASSSDLDGDFRPVGSGYDVGADEVVPPNVPVSKNLWLEISICIICLFFLRTFFSVTHPLG